MYSHAIPRGRAVTKQLFERRSERGICRRPFRERKVGATLAPDHTRSLALMKQVDLDSVPGVAAHSKAEVP